MEEMSGLRGRYRGLEKAAPWVYLLKQKESIMCCTGAVTAATGLYMIFSMGQNPSLEGFAKTFVYTMLAFFISWLTVALFFSFLISRFERTCLSVPIEDRESLARGLAEIVCSIREHNLVSEDLMEALSQHHCQSMLEPVSKKIELLKTEGRKYGLKLLSVSESEVGSAYIFVYGSQGLKKLIEELEAVASSIPEELNAELARQSAKEKSNAAKSRLNAVYE
jgi:hypothetical protein